MAHVEMNELVKALKGRIGNIVFKSWNGKVFISSRPEIRKKQSPLQRQNRARFAELAKQTKKRLTDPALRKHYSNEARRLKLPNAYTALLKETLAKDKSVS